MRWSATACVFVLTAASVQAAPLRTLLSDQFATLAKNTVAATPQDSGALTRAGILLDLAIQVHPTDAEIARLRAEWAGMAADRDAWQSAMQNYCNLRPDDDAAKLALILAGAAVHQTIDRRAQAVEAALHNAAISDPIRSRLASYLAAAALEQGDRQPAMVWLKHSLEYDRTNVQATRLAYDVIMATRPPQAIEAKALLQWLASAPHDPQPRFKLGQLLLAEGALQQAQEQFDIVSELAGQHSETLLRYRAIAIAAAGDRSRARHVLNLSANVGQHAALLQVLKTPHASLAPLGARDQLTDAGREVVAQLRKAYPAVRRPDPINKPWVGVRLHVQQQHIGPFDPIEAVVQLRNQTDVPVSLGPGGMAPATAFLVVTPAGPQQDLPDATPTVIDLHRRITLQRRQWVNVSVRLYISQPRSAQLQLTVVHDPRINPDGSVTARHVRAVDQLTNIRYAGMHVTPNGLNQLIVAAGDVTDGDARVKAVAQLVTMVSLVDNNRANIVNAIDAAIPTLDAVQLAWLICQAPRGALWPSLARRANASKDVMVQIAFLATGRGMPDAISDDRVRRFMQAMPR